jgi:hypothetical protein
MGTRLSVGSESLPDLHYITHGAEPAPSHRGRAFVRYCLPCPVAAPVLPTPARISATPPAPSHNVVEPDTGKFLPTIGAIAFAVCWSGDQQPKPVHRRRNGTSSIRPCPLRRQPALHRSGYFRLQLQLGEPPGHNLPPSPCGRSASLFSPQRFYAGSSRN